MFRVSEIDSEHPFTFIEKCVKRSLLDHCWGLSMELSAPVQLLYSDLHVRIVADVGRNNSSISVDNAKGLLLQGWMMGILTK